MIRRILTVGVFVCIAYRAIRTDRRRRRYEAVMRERAERMAMQWRVTGTQRRGHV